MIVTSLSCCGARYLPCRQAAASAIDRCQSLRSLALPPAALPSLPRSVTLLLFKFPIYRAVWVREWNALRALAFLQNAGENGFPRPLRRASLAQGPRNDKLGKLLVSKVNLPNLSLRNQSADWLWQSVFPAMHSIASTVRSIVSTTPTAR